MCGIAGFLGAGDRGDIARMTGAIAHRGPDAEGFFADPAGGLHFGHRRLSIIDLSCGAQPMTSPDGRFTIVFNGEIYNHAELRADLEARGRRFATDHSDTEVLLQGIVADGPDFVHRLNGMWAFAIWDAAERRLFLSRDRFGKKPLYWFFERGTFAFASELTALLAHPDAPRSVSALAVRKLFAYCLIPAPHSIVERIWKVPAGHHLTFDEGRRPEIRRYWHFEIEPDEDMARRSEDDLAADLRERLDRAVKRRLVSDVPLGVFLSGGIDSTAVAAFAAKYAPDIRTFSIGFSEPTFDESPFAALAARALGTRHENEILDLDKAIDVLPRIFDRLDEPQGDNSLLPTWLLSRFTRRHVTVALGGDGGDELFAGYDTFRGLGQAQWFSRLVPPPLHRLMLQFARRLPVSHTNLSWDFKIKRGLGGVANPPALWNAAWLGALQPADLDLLPVGPAEIEEVYSEAIASWETCRQTNLVDRTLQFYTDIYLQDGILAKVDRATMMHGLEARSPFLDVDVADFARRLPHRFKVRGGVTKYLLKKALADVVPREITERKKKGFGTPVGAWFHSARLGLRNPNPLAAKRLAAHRAGTSDERHFLWCQLTLDEWRDRRIA